MHRSRSHPESPSAPAAACVCTAVRRLDRVLNRRYDEALRPSGLATTQYALLSTLARAGRPLPHGELAAMQEMAGTTLSRNLKPLERDGLVRIAAGEDRRTRLVAITEVGEVMLAEARPLWRAVQQRVVAEVGEERVERLLGELGEVLGRMRAVDSHAEAARVLKEDIATKAHGTRRDS